MPHRSIRLPESLDEQLEAEADEREKTVSEYIRGILRHRDEITRGDATASNDLAVRVEKLEERVADLEENQTSAESDTQQAANASIEGEVFAMGFDRDLTDERAGVLIEFLNWVAEQGSTQKSDFSEWWTDERGDRTGYGAKSFWEQFAKPAMKESPKFDQPNARTYRYVGASNE